MANRTKSFLIPLAAIGLLSLSGAPALQSAAVPAPAMTANECATLSLNATLARARLEMRAFQATEPRARADLSGAMDADARLAARVKQVFGHSEVIRSQFTRGSGCLVTVQLSLERLKQLSRDL